MKLRNLCLADAPLMLEWMHDESVVQNLQANFAAKTLDDCQAFIRSSEDASENLHLAIADDNDEYMGTVSLKHIHEGKAEFAITIRSCAMGKGFAQFGMNAILEKGIQELGLDSIYWCVSQHNARAVRFYDKNGYTRTQDVPISIVSAYTPEQCADFIWYIYN